MERAASVMDNACACAEKYGTGVRLVNLSKLLENHQRHRFLETVMLGGSV
jgi:hypothetical protein